jgi:rhodanese-related sulfurtransferase
MMECTVLELIEKISNTNTTLVDVREYAEYANGRVSGAKLLPLSELAPRHKEIEKDHSIFVICRSGIRSAVAQKRLNALGFRHVVNVKGGFDAWKAVNLPVESDDKAPWELDRQVRLIAGILILVGVILSLTVHQYFIGISTFVGLGLTFAGATGWCGMALLLAKMPWNRPKHVGG